MAEVTLQFERKRDTKTKAVFEEVEEPGKPPVVGTLYVAKWWANGATTLTVEVRTK